jgi:tripartite-type tricarboxylate transporter receptor subunit TctC
MRQVHKPASNTQDAIQRRHLLGGGAAGMLWAIGVPAQAQADFPNRPIKIVVPYSAGTGSDALARTVAQGVTDKTGKPVIVENREGGGSLIGTMAVAKAPADGYTILIAANPMAIVPASQSQPQYNPARDFAPEAKVGDIPLVLATSPSLGFKSVRDLIAHAKAKPGKLRYG